MTSCPDPQDHPPREVLSYLIDLVAWAKTCLYVAAATAPGSAERARELVTLRKAVTEPRRVADEILGGKQKLPHEVLVALRVCELAIPKLEAGAVLRQTSPQGGAQ